MSVAPISSLPAFQPLNLSQDTTNKSGPNGSNGPNGTNGTQTSLATGQIQGPGPDNGDTGNQTGAAATQTTAPSRQMQLPQTGQGTGLAINILV